MARPDLPKGYLGAQPKFSEYGLECLSHKEPEITTMKNEVEITFKMDKGRPVKVTGNLLNASDNSDFSNLIFTQTQGDTISYLLQIPSEGYYKMQVYALPLSDDSKTLQGVYNYLIKCERATSSVFPYPKQYAQWKEGCYLYEPMVLHDSPGNVRFKVYIPKARAVAVTFNEEWNHLNDTGNDVWEGTVVLDKSKGSKVKLNANFSGEEAKYSTLLEYTL